MIFMWNNGYLFLVNYNVMGVKVPYVGTKWKIYTATYMFLCFLAQKLFSCIFSIQCLLSPPLHHNGKGSRAREDEHLGPRLSPTQSPPHRLAIRTSLGVQPVSVGPPSDGCHKLVGSGETCSGQ